MKIPAIITAGDSATWIDDPFNDNQGNGVSSGAYTLGYSFRGPSGTGGVDLAGTTSGSGWQLTLSTAQSAAMNSGATAQTWYWQAYATKSGVRITAGEGTLYVKPNLVGLTVSTTFDGTSKAEQVLAAIEAEILARTTGGMTLEYTIGNRSLKKEPATTLLALRSQYRLIVSRERRAQSIANGLGNPGRIGIRFT